MGDDRWISGLVAVVLVAQLILTGILFVRLGTLNENVLGLYRLLVESSGASEPSGRVEGFEPGDGPSRGPADAPVTLVEYSDFACTACRQAQPRLDAFLEAHGDQVRLVFRHFPLRPEGHTVLAAIAGECAHRQGAFWPMHDLLFAHSGTFTRQSLVGYAESLRLDVGAFRQCLDSEDAAAKVQDDRQAGVNYGIRATPTFFMGERIAVGALSQAAFQKLLDEVRSSR